MHARTSSGGGGISSGFLCNQSLFRPSFGVMAAVRFWLKALLILGSFPNPRMLVT
jgi:hypothetical protein